MKESIYKNEIYFFKNSCPELTYVLSSLSVSVDSVREVAELEQALLRKEFICMHLCHHEWAEWHFYLLRMCISFDLDTFEVHFGQNQAFLSPRDFVCRQIWQKSDRFSPLSTLLTNYCKHSIHSSLQVNGIFHLFSQHPFLARKQVYTSTSGSHSNLLLLFF